MKLLLFFSSVALLSSRATPAPIDDDAAHPGLFEDDILGFDEIDRNAISNVRKRWTGKTIPYVIDDELAASTDRIRSAMDHFEEHTCLEFVPRTDQRNYVKIWKGQGCRSSVGMIGGQQLLSLGQGCLDKGTVVHELNHAVGFYHEHNRSDRDDHLHIYWENIREELKSNFKKLTPQQNILYDAFDYGSIMIYSGKAFQKTKGLLTLAAKDGTSILDAYAKPGLAPSDVYRINRMYDCPD